MAKKFTLSPVAMAAIAEAMHMRADHFEALSKAQERFDPALAAKSMVEANLSRGMAQVLENDTTFVITNKKLDAAPPASKAQH